MPWELPELVYIKEDIKKVGQHHFFQFTFLFKLTIGEFSIRKHSCGKEKKHMYLGELIECKCRVPSTVSIPVVNFVTLRSCVTQSCRLKKYYRFLKPIIFGIIEKVSSQRLTKCYYFGLLYFKILGKRSKTDILLMASFQNYLQIEHWRNQATNLVT